MTANGSVATRRTGTPPWLASVVRVVGFGLVMSAEGFVIGAVGDAFTPANHFSYFTVLSNLLAAAVFAVGLVRPVPDVVRGAAVTYMITTGVVYAVLLQGVDVQTPAYSNVVLHMVVPVIVVIEWLLFPPSAPVPLRRAIWWLAFPVIYLVYSLVRGPSADWYAYPFLDPRPAGYGAVAITCVLVAVGIGVFGAATWAVGNWRARQQAATSD